MANYAYNPRTSSGGGGLNLQPFLQALGSMTNLTKGFYNADTDAALQYFIDQTRPSSSYEELIRRMAPAIKNQWVGEQYGAFSPGGNQQPRSFLDFMSNYNFGREFASMNPQARRENRSYFDRPTRWINF